jgi:hypothetical protein
MVFLLKEADRYREKKQEEDEHNDIVAYNILDTIT